MITVSICQKASLIYFLKLLLLHGAFVKFLALIPHLLDHIYSFSGGIYINKNLLLFSIYSEVQVMGAVATAWWINGIWFIISWIMYQNYPLKSCFSQRKVFFSISSFTWLANYCIWIQVVRQHISVQRDYFAQPFESNFFLHSTWVQICI